MWIGVDILGVNELDRLHTRAWFRRYVYAEAELAIANSFGDLREREFLAGRFAAKEAVLKALGVGCRLGLAPRQVSVLRDKNSAPIVRLSGPAARRAAALGMFEIAVSIAHKGDWVVAVAIGSPDASGTLDNGVAGIAQTTLQEIIQSRATTDGEQRCLM